VSRSRTYVIGKAEKSLYLELEKITSAWETLDRQIKNKIFDLSSLEEKLSKSQMDVSGQIIGEEVQTEIVFCRKPGQITDIMQLYGRKRHWRTKKRIRRDWLKSNRWLWKPYMMFRKI